MRVDLASTSPGGSTVHDRTSGIGAGGEPIAVAGGVLRGCGTVPTSSHPAAVHSADPQAADPAVVIEPFDQIAGSRRLGLDGVRLDLPTGWRTVRQDQRGGVTTRLFDGAAMVAAHDNEHTLLVLVLVTAPHGGLECSTGHQVLRALRFEA
jgi:hypothetical protein